MANAMLDARQEDGAYRRVELITGQRRRRRSFQRLSHRAPEVRARGPARCLPTALSSPRRPA
jgi:hypothetical protein